MEALLLYWLKANVVLALFVAAYYALLRRLTFFELNRAYLLFALGFAAVYPLLPMPALLPAAAGVPLVASSAASGAAAPVGLAAAPGLGPWQLAGAGYLAGAAALLLRLLGQLLSLAWVRRRARPATVLGQAVRVVPGAGSPFSFGTTIFLTNGTLADAAALPATLRHEQAHVRQAHTLDVLLLQLATALAWPNPAAWLLRRAALGNLEYLADQAALQASNLARRDYQYLLLRQQVGGVPVPALAFQLSLLTLKSRIQMLNQPLSSARQRGRYLLTAPVVVLLALGYAGARAQTAQTAAATGWHLPANTQVYIDGIASTSTAAEALDPKLISSLNVLNGTQGRIFTQGTSTNALIFTTITSKQAPAKQALDARLTQVTELMPSITPHELPPPAQSYVARHFADCRIAEANKILLAAHQQATYQVTVAKGRRPLGYLLFDQAGNFLEKI